MLRRRLHRNIDCCCDDLSVFDHTHTEIWQARANCLCYRKTSISQSRTHDGRRIRIMRTCVEARTMLSFQEPMNCKQQRCRFLLLETDTLFAQQGHVSSCHWKLPTHPLHLGLTTPTSANASYVDHASVVLLMLLVDICVRFR
jgi:hypothetical protein